MPLPFHFLLNFEKISVLNNEKEQQYSREDFLKITAKLKALILELAAIKGLTADSTTDAIKEKLIQNKITFTKVTDVVNDTSFWLWSNSKPDFLSASGFELMTELLELQRLCSATPVEELTAEINGLLMLSCHYIYGLQNQLLAEKNPMCKSPQDASGVSNEFADNQETLDYFSKHLQELQHNLAKVRIKLNTSTASPEEFDYLYDKIDPKHQELKMMQQWLVIFLATNKLDNPTTRTKAFENIENAVQQWCEIRERTNLIINHLDTQALRSPLNSNQRATKKEYENLINRINTAIETLNQKLGKQNVSTTDTSTQAANTEVMFIMARAKGQQQAKKQVQQSKKEHLEKNALRDADQGVVPGTLKVFPLEIDPAILKIKTELQKYFMRAEKEINSVWITNFFCIPITRKSNQKMNCTIARQLFAAIEKCIAIQTPVRLDKIAQRIVPKLHTIRSDELNNILKKMRGEVNDDNTNITTLNSILGR